MTVSFQLVELLPEANGVSPQQPPGNALEVLSGATDGMEVEFLNSNGLATDRAPLKNGQAWPAVFAAFRIYFPTVVDSDTPVRLLVWNEVDVDRHARIEASPPVYAKGIAADSNGSVATGLQELTTLPSATEWLNTVGRDDVGHVEIAGSVGCDGGSNSWFLYLTETSKSVPAVQIPYVRVRATTVMPAGPAARSGVSLGFRQYPINGGKLYVENNTGSARIFYWNVWGVRR